MKNVGELRERIECAFSSLIDSADAARDIAFHMTDWDHNLERLLQLYEDPPTATDDDITAVILEFLAHAPNHLAAAKKLSGMGPIEDIFGVGVLEEDED
jgi:hypothetical protein